MQENIIIIDQLNADAEREDMKFGTRIISTNGYFLLIFILFVILITMINCGRDADSDQLKERILNNRRYDINQFILEKLGSNRIIMLADGEHGCHVYMQRVVSFLNYWLKAVEEGDIESKDIPKRLILIIERDSVEIQNLKHYFITGNSLDIIHPNHLSSPQFTISTIEYSADLGEFRKIIDSINLANNKEKVYFDIFGPERVVDLSNWSAPKRDSFFIFEKDKYSSQQIIKLLESNPDAKALIFYGAAHLNKRPSIKYAGQLSAEGRFLAGYLNEYFADKGGVYTIGQSPVTMYNRELKGYWAPCSTYVIEENKIKGIPVYDSLARARLDFDSWIIHFDTNFKERPLTFAKSENIINIIIQNLDNPLSMSDDFYRSFLEQSLRYLTMISGREIDTFHTDDVIELDSIINKWKGWHLSAKLDIVEDIRSMVLWRRILERMEKSQGRFTNWYEYLTALAAGMEPWFDTTILPQDRADIYREYLAADRKKIIVENLVQMLWVASDSEKEKAIKILRQETGQDFDTPKEWLVWFRESREAL
jgi:hypothetical protein